MVVIGALKRLRQDAVTLAADRDASVHSIVGWDKRSVVPPVDRVAVDLALGSSYLYTAC